MPVAHNSRKGQAALYIRSDRAEVRTPLLGVLGGMGPLATTDFLRKLVRLTPARRDQDHIPLIAASVPQIPDRTAAILDGGPSPLPALLSALAMLERCGATRIAIPCNTAHFWFDSLQAQTSVPIFHIADAVAERLKHINGASGPVGLLATSATIKANIYAARLRASGFRCLVPPDDDQEVVMMAIRAVKAGCCDDTLVQQLRRVARKLEDRGASVIVLGCTELPLLASSLSSLALLDATEALAEACVRCADWKAGDT